MPKQTKIHNFLYRHKGKISSTGQIQTAFQQEKQQSTTIQLVLLMSSQYTTIFCTNPQE